MAPARLFRVTIFMQQLKLRRERTEAAGPARPRSGASTTQRDERTAPTGRFYNE